MERRAGVEIVDAIETARRASKHSKRSQQAQDATGVRGCHVCGFPGLGRVWRLPANRAIVSGPWLGPYGMDGKGDSPTLALEGYATKRDLRQVRVLVLLDASQIRVRGSQPTLDLKPATDEALDGGEKQWQFLDTPYCGACCSGGVPLGYRGVIVAEKKG